MFRKDVRMADQPGGQVLVTDIPLPAQEDGYSPGSLAESWNLETLETSAPPAVPEPCEAVDAISCDSDDSDSSSDSEADSCATETLEEQAKNIPEVQPPAQKSTPKMYQHKKSKVVHYASLFGTSFTCGRQLTQEYRACSDRLVIDSMRCQQCPRRVDSRTHDGDLENMEAVVKRSRRQ